MNDLSVPVIWLGSETLVTDVVADPILSLGVPYYTYDNGTPDDPSDDIPYYDMTVSSWTAESVSLAADGTITIGTESFTMADLTFEADWGDNIEEEQTWIDGRFVRVELAVYADLPGDLTMTGLEMVNLVELYPDEDWGDAKEIWVTTGDKVEYDKVLVYDPSVTMTVTAPDGTTVVVTEVDWGAEINQSGKVIYGSLWDTADDDYDVDGLEKFTVAVDFTVIPDEVAATFSQVINLADERTGGPPEGGDAPDHAGPPGGDAPGGGGPPDDQGGGPPDGDQGGPPQDTEGVEDEPGSGGQGEGQPEDAGNDDSGQPEDAGNDGGGQPEDAGNDDSGKPEDSGN